MLWRSKVDHPKFRTKITALPQKFRCLSSKHFCLSKEIEIGKITPEIISLGDGIINKNRMALAKAITLGSHLLFLKCSGK
jgi:hypothetical protein